MGNCYIEVDFGIKPMKLLLTGWEPWVCLLELCCQPWLDVRPERHNSNIQGFENFCWWRERVFEGFVCSSLWIRISTSKSSLGLFARIIWPIRGSRPVHLLLEFFIKILKIICFLPVLIFRNPKQSDVRHSWS